jgi:hypothetical protein
VVFDGSGLIGGVVFDGSGLIGGVVFDGSGLIRGVVFDGSGLIRGVVFDGSGLIRGELLYYVRELLVFNATFNNISSYFFTDIFVDIRNCTILIKACAG